jgi:hypothetical protein
MHAWSYASHWCALELCQGPGAGLLLQLTLFSASHDRHLSHHLLHALQAEEQADPVPDEHVHEPHVEHGGWQLPLLVTFVQPLCTLADGLMAAPGGG